MLSRSDAVDEIVRKRIRHARPGDLIDNFGDAAKINRLAEVYGGTYTQAWDEVRRAYKQQVKKIELQVDI
jgi:hypothetical protein